MSKKYIVRDGETPVDVTRKFTGGSARLDELVDANPAFPKIQVEVSGQVGTPPVITFDPQHWGENSVVRLPEHWDGNGGGQVGDAGGAGAGTVGQISKLEEMEEEEGMAASECTAGPTISDIKEYRYELQEGESLSGITQRWGLPARKWLELAGANRQIPGKYYGSGATRHCEPDRTKMWAGLLLKVPKRWPDPPESLWPHLKNSDGTPYTPGGEPGDVGPGGEGGEGIDPTTWYGDSASGWIWPVLIVGAAALGGVALIGATKKKGR